MRRVLFATTLLGATVTALAAKAAASPLELTGSVGALAWNTDDAYVRRPTGIGGRLRLEASAGAGPVSAAMRADVSSQPDMADKRGSSRLREAWVRYRAALADVTLGRQLMPTGRTDVIVLQDQFAPRDLTQLSMTEVEQQFGVQALRVDVYPSEELTVSAAVVRQDRAYVMPRQIGRALPGGAGLPDEPARAGLARIEYRKGIVEFAATLSRGANPLPGVELVGGKPTLAHPMEKRLAFDGALSLDGSVLRWDLVHARADTDSLPGYSRRRSLGSLGWDRGLWTDANLSVQAIFRHDEPAQPGAAGTALAPLFDANLRLSQAFRPSQRFVTATLKQRFRTQHQLESGFLVGSERQRAFIQRWVWQLHDHFAFQSKFQIVRGGSDTLIGNLGYKKLLYAELRYQF